MIWKIKSLLTHAGKIEGSFVEKILDIFSKRFGAEIARKSVTKGENQAWYMDQTMVTISQHSTSVVIAYSADFVRDLM